MAFQRGERVPPRAHAGIARYDRRALAGEFAEILRDAALGASRTQTRRAVEGRKRCKRGERCKRCERRRRGEARVVILDGVMSSWGALGLACLVAATFSCASCARPPIYDWGAESALGYRIGPGDALRVVVWKHEELSTQVAVRPDGAISLPLVGDVPATGRSASEIATDVQGRLHRYYQDDPPVTVQVQEVKSYKIYVVGEVNKPGEYAPSHEVTVLMGLSLAGGFTRFADADRIVIVRRDARGERRIPFDYSAVVSRGELRQDIALELGDTVVVP